MLGTGWCLGPEVVALFFHTLGQLNSPSDVAFYSGVMDMANNTSELVLA